MTSNSVVQFYRTVIDDVINNVRETFLDDGIDEQVLLELKQVWESKITQSKALPSENETAAARETEVGSSSTSSAAADSASKSSGNSSRATVVASTVTSTPSAAVSTAATAAAAVTSTVVNSVGSSAGVQYHYTTAGGQGDEVSKTVTITLPSQASTPGQKPVTITLPAHLMQNPQAGGIIMSASAAAAAQALPAGIAAGLLQSQLTRVITQQQPDGTTVSYQAVTAEQLAKQGYVLNMTTPRPTITPAPTSAAAALPQQPPASSSSSSTGQVQAGGIIQLDGANDTSDDDDDDDDLRDDDNDPDDDDDKIDENEGVEEEVDSDPLNSEDDVSDEDPSELFDTDNVIVCQYDKITRSRNKWKFHLKDGIMNLQGKDYIFQKAIGDAEW